MVDYSKWDRMEFSDSEDDVEPNHQAPRVTSLDTPGRVTIGTDGCLEIGESSLPPNRSCHAAAAVNAQPDQSSVKELARKKQKLQQWREELTHNGGTHHVSIPTKDEGHVELPIYWAQDRYAITLRLGFPDRLFSPKSICVKVTGALNYKDRFSAVGSGAMSGYKEMNEDGSAAFGEIKITSAAADKHETVLLCDKLPRPVFLNQDEDDVGFDIEDILTEQTAAPGDQLCTKFVTITLSKAVPMEGMTIWWEHALLSLPKIDTTQIRERTNPVDRVMTVEEYNESMDRNQSTASAGDASKKEAFAKAWNEAHQMFREKVKAKEKQEINVDD
jgi:hypothetical protein